MKVNYLLAILFLSFVSIVVIANINDTKLIGCTELNGYGCVCHTVEKDTAVHVWIEGPESLLVGQTGFYRMFMSGGPAQAGGYNVAGRFGEMVLVDTFSRQHPLAMNELTQAFSLPFPTTQDTIYWEFGYTAFETSTNWDTLYSCGLSLLWDSIPDHYDRWNFGPKFPLKILSPSDVNANAFRPEDFVLYQNYPNPFNPSTKIKFTIPQNVKSEKQYVTLKVFDVLGNEVAVLVDEEKYAGDYEIEFSPGTVIEYQASGIFLYQLTVGSLRETKKMVFLK